jgi:starch phosphorylase
MRILVDEERLRWDDAWGVCAEVFSYTNHTIMSEALERWPVQFFKQNLPRIFQIVQEMNETYCRALWDAYPGEWDRIAAMAIIADGEIRMANLCVVMCKSVNGVSALHTDILKNQVFNLYYKYRPDQFVNVTNGVTHRRWLLYANPGLARLVTEALGGDDWILDPERLQGLAAFERDAPFLARLAEVKRQNKERLAEHIAATSGTRVDPASLFDVQVKRLHEYKRQLLNIVHILYLYREIRRDPAAVPWPRTFVFGAKASPGYYRARLIIKLINSVAAYIAKDPRARDLLRVVFVENYGVSLAEKIIPAADVSEQISTAGKEASGTGNMKFMLNGAVTVGTLDGANVEMRERVGDDNIYIFGLRADEVDQLYREGYDSKGIYERDERLRGAIGMIEDGSLEPDKPRLFADIFNSLLYNEGGLSDQYLVLRDFDSYQETQARLARDYLDRQAWNRKSLANIAAAGYFSSDRSILEYNEQIWHLK